MELAKRLLPGLLPFLIGCSPVYVAKSATGHMALLSKRKSITKALNHPKTDPELRRRLAVVDDARRFAFGYLSLKKSRDYSSYVEKKGPLSYIVSGSDKLKLNQVTWKFPIAGRFPYKGFFNPKDANKEKEKLEAKGLDAFVSGAAAYNTPLWFADPIPSSALEDSTGSIAGLIIHELAHGTVYYGNQMAFNESAATFIGHQGAIDYLVDRYGPDSPELAAFNEELRKEVDFEKEIARLRIELEALYKSDATDEEKLKKREELFAASRQTLKSIGMDVPNLNNAAVLAFTVYRGDLPLMRRAFEKCGRNWKAFLTMLNGLDEREPSVDLAGKVSSRSAR